MSFPKDILKIDGKRESERICDFIRQQVLALRRKGAVIGLSGGVDSAAAAVLCVQALGRKNVLGLILPERDSHPQSKPYALRQAKRTGIKTKSVDISRCLEGFGTYEQRDKAVKEIFPEYDSHYKLKISLPPDIFSNKAFNFFTLTIADPKGRTKSARLKKNSLLEIIAATNSKQRARMMHLYYYAEKMNYLVCGTLNRTENIQGFFVKYGDAGVDIEPLAHLYKTQVYQLAAYLGVIEDIRKRTPSADTYSLPLSDEEFYFRLPYEKLDLLLYAWENQVPLKAVSRWMELAEDQVQRAFRDFTAKYKLTAHMRKFPPALTDEGGHVP